MNSSNYHHNMLHIFSSPSYKPLSNNPLQYVFNCVTKSIKASSFDPANKNILISLNRITPRNFFQPKIHKHTNPLKPIFSTIDSPTHAISKFLAKKFYPWSSHSSSLVKDSYNFIQLIKNLKLDENGIMVNFDFISLFTKIHVPKAIDLLFNLVHLETLSLINIFRTTTFFTFNGACYEQVEGTTMGSSLSPIFANTFLEIFEVKDLETFRLKSKCC